MLGINRNLRHTFTGQNFVDASELMSELHTFKSAIGTVVKCLGDLKSGPGGALLLAYSRICNRREPSLERIAFPLNDFAHFLRLVAAFDECVEQALAMVEQGELGLTKIKDLPADYVFGVALPGLYEAHFGRRFGVSRNEHGELDGPAVRFAMQAADDLGVPKSDAISYDKSVILNTRRRMSEH
jgi:hypothetical protein